ncbi:DGQHR domain-containing protein [Streptomyces rugosispiralis]|uniref:DGQHR domain-containing protein n=1 Tax=Streptomyces rugosispiralis TaxID=2967341 RepID=A0ABT1VCM4_9ACTN|nr:DGQHR domain-containing protein [Streptomyces rugosispiralis]MCQ8195158.1 DGQHR domain-containing protein [Streptomyces rugosispiralis]
MDTQIPPSRATDIEAIAEARRKHDEVIADLLETSISREDALFVEVAHMGGTPSYIASVSLEWIRRQVNLTDTMPLLKRSIDKETGKLRIDEESIEIISQRSIDWSREAVLAKYLIERDTHKFPPILAVLSQPWVDDPDSEMWDEEGCAKEASIAFRRLDVRGRLGLIDLSAKSRLYALDGQHRVIGIKAALELISTGRLDVRDKDRKVKRDEMLSLDDLVAENGLDEAQLQQLGDERMGIEIIPAVLKGESRADAQLRVRTTFTHVNKQASPLTPGEIAQLDEDDGFAIVARRVAVGHPFLTRVKSAVNFKNSTISSRSVPITTLQTLTWMARTYLLAHNDYAGWATKGKELARRPEKAGLARGVADYTALWDHIAELPTFRAIAAGEPVARHRRFAHEDKTGVGYGHLLLRPVGQQALAQAVGLLHAEGMSLDHIFAKLTTLDRRGALRLDAVENPWWGVLYDINGKRISIKGRETAIKILRHMVGGLPTEKDRKVLREAIVEARSIGDGECRDYTNNIVPKSKIGLPEQL